MGRAAPCCRTNAYKPEGSHETAAGNVPLHRRVHDAPGNRAPSRAAWAAPYDAGERPHFGAADSRNAHCWTLMRIVWPDIDGSDAIPHIFQGDTNEHARQEKRTD